MVRDDSSEIKRQCHRRALRYLRGDGVENVRREVSKAAIARKQVGGKHELETLAVEAHMPASVTGEMDCPQSLPYVEKVTVVDPAIRNKRAESKNRPPDVFQATCDSCPALIMRMPCKVVSVETRSSDPSASLACNRAHIENVIEVPVSDNNAANGLTLPTALSQRTPQEEPPSDESSVEQIHPRRISKNVEVERWSSDLENIGLEICTHIGL